MMDFNICQEDAGRTVLSFLKSKIKISTSALASLKQIDMGICVNGDHVTVRYILQEDDILSIKEADSFSDINKTIEPHLLPLDILLENDDIFIINKSANMPTHPSHNHTNDTLANALAYIYEERNEPFVFRPIGRLDKNTSGISLIAKNAISASFLHYARSHGLMTKKYIALLEGKIANDSNWHTTETHMKRMKDSVIVRCIGDNSDPEAFNAITHWRMIFSNDHISLVEAIPKTGRTHQLRVHFAHLGHPILGDDIYGNISEHIDRHALHAYSLSIPVPYGGEITTFVSMPPQDMQNAFFALSETNISAIIENIIEENNEKNKRDLSKSYN